MKRYWSQLSFGVSTTSFRDRGAEYGLVTFRAIVQQTDPDRPQTSISTLPGPWRLYTVFFSKTVFIGLLYIS